MKCVFCGTTGDALGNKVATCGLCEKPHCKDCHNKEAWNIPKSWKERFSK